MRYGIKRRGFELGNSGAVDGYGVAAEALNHKEVTKEV